MKILRLPRPYAISFILGCHLLATAALAQWSADPAANNAICTNYYDQNQLTVVSDGSGGAIMCWNDRRNNRGGVFNDEIYVQRIGFNGITLWTSDGIKATPSNVWSYSYAACSDGNGGAYIAWHAVIDSNRLYVQHIDAGGALLWDSSGVLICSGTVSDQMTPTIASDGSGGAVIAWGDTRNNAGINDDDLYAQRVNAAGVVLWAANGLVVAGASGFQGGSLQMKSDGSGGAVLAWEDSRSETTSEIYAQRIDSIGSRLWTAGGVLLNSVAGGSLYPKMISEAGGAIVCWVDRRNGSTDLNIYAQKVSAGGTVEWADNGAAICAASGNQNAPQLTSDGSGGAIIAWNELGAGIPNPNIYAQRVDAGGTAQWTINGIGVCAAVGGQGFPQLTSDGKGGAFITWQDARTGNIQDVYAQRIDSTGASMWTNDGVAVSTATFVQSFPLVLNDDVNGVIIAWADLRSDLGGQRHDIYAQRVNSDGTLGPVTDVQDNDRYLPSAYGLDQNYPNPFNPSTTVSYFIPGRNYVTLKVFNVLGQEVALLVNAMEEPGYKSLRFDGSNLPSGVYFYRLQAGSFSGTKMLMIVR